MFWLKQNFIFFVFSSSIACFFLSFCYHILLLPPSPPPFFSSSSLFLWVINCSFFRFLFCLLLSSGALKSRFSFLSASLFFFCLCLFLCFSGLSVVFVSLGFSLPFSPFASLLRRLVFLLGSPVICWRFGFSGISPAHPPSPPPAFATFVFLLLRSPSASFLRFLADT